MKKKKEFETIHELEYRGYRVRIIKHGDGKPYMFSCREEGVSYSIDNKNNYMNIEESIIHIKKELDKKPECFRWKSYDRNKKSDFSLTEDIETKRRFIINDFEKHLFKDCEGVKWVINFPELEEIKGYSNLRYYPKLIQHNGFEIWFEFNAEYDPKDKDFTLTLLENTFKKLECKPLLDDGNMYWQSFDLRKNSYFSDEYELEIREDHPRHGNKYVKFYINADYSEPNKLHSEDELKVFVK